jgi:hypothetical protein
MKNRMSLLTLRPTARRALAASLCALSVMSFTVAVATPAFAAAPSVDQVEQAIARGDLQGAQSMLDQVVAAHPGSARAHYLDAQVLERNHRYADALTQINAARNIDPAIAFTDPAKFRTVQRRIESEANRAGSGTGGTVSAPHNGTVSSTINNPIATTAPATAAAAAVPREKHGPSAMTWIFLLIVVAAVVGMIMWSMRKRREQEDTGTENIHRDLLKRATELMQTIRATKLDLKLSTSPDRQAWIADAEDVEGRLRTLIDDLSADDNRFARASPDASPSYQLDALAQRIERIKAFAEGRPDPLAANANPAAGGNQSAYANEADRLSRPGYGQPGGEWQQPPQQAAPQQVIVQQPGGLGSGMGGLMTGVLLGEMLGGHRERDVIVEHDRAPSGGAGQPNQDAGMDFGNGNDGWQDDNSQIDAGNSDDNSWDDT